MSEIDITKLPIVQYETAILTKEGWKVTIETPLQRTLRLLDEKIKEWEAEAMASFWKDGDRYKE